MNASLVKLSFFLMLIAFASGMKFEIERQDSETNGVDCKVRSNCEGCICGKLTPCSCCNDGACVCFRIDQPNTTLQILKPDAELNGPTCQATGTSSCKRCVCGGKLGLCSCCFNGVCACYRIDFKQIMSHKDIMNY
ncbi:PREDICTED: uncharacterized protein LOC109356495 [Lupinus angustifolius]|uniref:uncharacterized protein LOC109356495 n=1 Tax=Lupinus angustifolius TaxID=3871 RepID=UPI00092F09E3|nr:PREDICTED: uncharacterized protein LOC109356495 [Lupinus angustifolius]